ncbi:MAG: sigma-54-dependent Fis family transcriptional regulator [Deferribacteres bacterium]|nr:sigma-54-dependent Fis family transcriptional regulator [candidate division KSB1 bacterium]MCB9503424.1 sigma-54-dependent Fis family transcriptional regulator [Deferribacteres bacterium]
MQEVASGDFSVRKIMNEIVGLSPAIVRVKRAARKIAKSNEDCLIVGEAGVGKTQIAHIIYRLSRRRNKPFVSLHPSEFYEKNGSADSLSLRFNQAVEAAAGGTLAVFEVEDFPEHQKFQLLELMQGTNGYQKYWETDGRPRIISTSKLKPEAAFEQKAISTKLYYKLNRVMLEVPSLRSRKQDIPYLYRKFVRKAARSHGIPLESFTLGEDLFEGLMLYNWPGNVEELKNCIRTLVVTAENGKVNPAVLPFLDREDPLKIFVEKSLPDAVQVVENYLIKKALGRFEGNQTKAAQHLQISEASLRYKLKKYEIENK